MWLSLLRLLTKNSCINLKKFLIPQMIRIRVPKNGPIMDRRLWHGVVRHEFRIAHMGHIIWTICYRTNQLVNSWQRKNFRENLHVEISSSSLNRNDKSRGNFSLQFEFIKMTHHKISEWWVTFRWWVIYPNEKINLILLSCEKKVLKEIFKGENEDERPG